MNGEPGAHTTVQETERTDPPDVLKRLVNLDDVEVVTTASGEVLYIVQFPDD